MRSINSCKLRFQQKPYHECPPCRHRCEAGILVKSERSFSNMDYFTADPHFGDKRLHLFPRPFTTPEECREHIIQEYNRFLTPEDTLYLVGDVAIDENELPHLNRIHGRKVLVRGNYDRLPDVAYAPYFSSVHDSLDLTLQHEGKSLEVHIQHYPSQAIASAFNLVGHIHGAWRVQKNILNVGVDAHFFRPVSVAQIFFYHNAICRFFDEDVWCADLPANKAHATRGKPGAAATGSLRT